MSKVNSNFDRFEVKKSAFRNSKYPINIDEADVKKF